MDKPYFHNKHFTTLGKNCCVKTRRGYFKISHKFVNVKGHSDYIERLFLNQSNPIIFMAATFYCPNRVLLWIHSTVKKHF